MMYFIMNQINRQKQIFDKYNKCINIKTSKYFIILVIL